MKPVGELLGAVLAGVSERSGSASALEAVWRQVAGEVPARHSAPVRLEGPTLVVACDDDTWRQALEQQASVLLTRLTASLGHARIARLRFEVR